MLNESLFSSKTDQWETPADLFKKLNDEFHFTLDPCADESNHKCEKYFTKEQNGLIQDWSQDVVFCNPPYGRNIGEWVKKAFESVSSHTHTHTHTVVMLLPARTDTKWFHNYIYHKAEIRFIRGRLKFGGSKNSAPFPSMVVVFRSIW